MSRDQYPPFLVLHTLVGQTHKGYKRPFTESWRFKDTQAGRTNIEFLRSLRKVWHPHVHLDWQKKGQSFQCPDEQNSGRFIEEKFFYDFDGVTWLPFSVMQYTDPETREVVYPKMEIRLEVYYEEPRVSLEVMTRDDSVYQSFREGEWLHHHPMIGINIYRDLDAIDRLLEVKPQDSKGFFEVLNPDRCVQAAI